MICVCVSDYVCVGVYWWGQKSECDFAFIGMKEQSRGKLKHIHFIVFVGKSVIPEMNLSWMANCMVIFVPWTYNK